VKTVALKDPNSGSFTMCRLTGFGTISSDDREQYGTRVSLGNVKTSLDLKESRIVTLEDDKVVKDSKISALEDDKAVKDTKIANLESDKNDKDTRVVALETDKNEKDTKMSTMESDMALLASQVSLGNVRVSLGNLATRVSSLETLGIKGISNAVSWTNLTEINLSGEKLTNGDFSQTAYVQKPSYALPTSSNNSNDLYIFAEGERPFIQALQTVSGLYEGNIYRIHILNFSTNKIKVYTLEGTQIGWVNANGQGTLWEVVENEPTHWEKKNGSFDQSKLAQGIIKGVDGKVTIQQEFSQNIAQGTTLAFKIDSIGDVKFLPIKDTGQADSNNSFTVSASDGYGSHTTQTVVSGFRVNTNTASVELSSVSIFQGAVSGGTVQAYAGGGLEKISGTSGFNAGASSVQKIDGNSDGYVQFQWSSDSVRVGLKYSDTDYDVDSPYLEIDSTTNTIGTKSVAPGDWFRIRHYASTNEIKYQRKETVYSQNPNFVFETASGSNYQYPASSRPLVISLNGTGTLTIGELYEVYTIRRTDQGIYLRDLDGNAKGWHGGSTRGSRYEVVEEAGQDYVTFYTEPTLTNGNDLYVDVSLYHVGARINDVTIVT